MFPISDSIRSTRFPFFNVAFILLTVLVFFQQLTTQNPEAFIFNYALIPAVVEASDLTTLLPFVTAVFLHGGFLHIISNMWFLWVFGDDVESYFGWIFPVVYLISGIVGNLFQYLVMPNSFIPMIGASGAVAGVLGAYYVLFPHSKIKTLVPFFGFATLIDIPAPFMLGYWFLLQVFSGTISLPFTGEVGGVAFFAHIGGFISGILFAKLFQRYNI